MLDWYFFVLEDYLQMTCQCWNV